MKTIIFGVYMRWCHVHNIKQNNEDLFLHWRTPSHELIFFRDILTRSTDNYEEHLIRSKWNEKSFECHRGACLQLTNKCMYQYKTFIFPCYIIYLFILMDKRSVSTLLKRSLARDSLFSLIFTLRSLVNEEKNWRCTCRCSVFLLSTKQHDTGKKIFSIFFLSLASLFLLLIHINILLRFKKITQTYFPRPVKCHPGQLTQDCR